jgi:hypothetical protein
MGQAKMSRMVKDREAGRQETEDTNNRELMSKGIANNLERVN